MHTAYIRGYIDRPTIKQEQKQKKLPFKKSEHVDSDLMFIFDTETTTDEKQNLKVGCYAVLEKSSRVLLEQGMFYSNNHCSEKEIECIKRFSKKNNFDFLNHDDFIENVFYEYVFRQRATCVGFNLPFDISRIAIKCTPTRRIKFHNGFSFILTKNKIFPRIKIKSKGKSFSRIQFARSPLNKKRFNPGIFVDLHTYSMALSGETHISLEKAGVIFDSKVKKSKAYEHGSITSKYLDYLVNDVYATESLFYSLNCVLTKYEVNLEPNKIFSQASLGKAILKKMNIKNFQSLNPDFSPKVLGQIMSAYYGGRSEVACRKKPVPISLIDVTSMYPTVNILTGMHDFLVAEKIFVEECTEEIQSMLNSISIEDLQNKKMWKQLNVIVEIMPEDEILPLRGRFNPEKRSTNISLTQITSDVPMYYALPDLISSKLLTWKSPTIIKAYRFVPKGIQKNLKPISILGLNIDPRKDNIFRSLVNERQRIKKLMKSMDPNSPIYREHKAKEKVIKLLINSTSYGIFIEVNPETHLSKLDIYSFDSFQNFGKFEQKGTFFNPIMGVIITSASRLFLAIIESLLQTMGERHVFCDTDSMAVPPHTVKPLLDYFKPLNPYKHGVDLIKEENHNVLFYGISAKRYVLYHKKANEFDIVKHSLHGLGHLRNPFGVHQNDWHKRIWKTILEIHYGIISLSDLMQEYGNLRAVSQLSITYFPLFDRMKSVAKSDKYEDFVKPYNFVSVGFSINANNGDTIKPLAPYNIDTQLVTRQDFIDRETGKIYKGVEYWQPLSDTILRYIDHPESKLDGDVGYLEKRKINIKNLIVIGKEVKDLHNQVIQLDTATLYYDMAKLGKAILKMTSKDAEEIGVLKGTLSKIKKKVRDGRKFSLKTTAIKKILEAFLT